MKEKLVLREFGLKQANIFSMLLQHMCLIMFDHYHHKGLMEYSLAMHLNFSLCVENDDYCLSVCL